MEGIIFSIPVIAICTLGNETDIKPLPSFSVSATPPTSATKKLEPVTPTSAAVNFLRKT